MNARNILKTITLPLLVLAGLISLYFLWGVLDLPGQDKLVETAKGYFERYGLVVLFVSAFLEGTFLIGLYYPGSFVIFLSVVLAGSDPVRVVEAVGIATAGLYAGYLLDYCLGKYGWHKIFVAIGLREYIDNAKRRLEKYGLGAIFLGYWHPNFATAISTAAGILHFPFFKFMVSSLAAAVLWSAFWGGLIYVVGERILSFIGIPFAMVVVLAWTIYLLVHKKRTTSNVV